MLLVLYCLVLSRFAWSESQVGDLPLLRNSIGKLQPPPCRLRSASWFKASSTMHHRGLHRLVLTLAFQERAQLHCAVVLILRQPRNRADGVADKNQADLHPPHLLHGEEVGSDTNCQDHLGALTWREVGGRQGRGS